ncbi:MAG: hypothetical protein HY744_11625 [Deltaproteobacteria bacterium]|nr:hypothetical protein [Deltaproteobacteria bacterium]
MKHRTLGWAIGLLAAAAPLGFVLWWLPTGCAQAPIDCRSARGDFAARYTWVSGDPHCGGLTTGFVGLQSFYGADGTSQDYSRSSLAIQPDVLGYLLWTSQGFGVVDEANKPYGLGNFASTEPSDNVCSVPALSLAEQNIIEIPAEGTGGGGGAGGGAQGGGGGAPVGAGGVGGGAGGAGECPGPGPFPGQPAMDIKFQWSNVRLLVTTAAPGTRFLADLAYPETIGAVSCSANYRVVGIWPPVDCGIYEFDECGNVASATPDETVCHLDPSTAPPGSVVINPDFATSCDPSLLYCVPTTPVADLH